MYIETHFGSLANPTELGENSQRKKYYPDPALENKRDSDPTLKKKPGQVPKHEKKTGLDHKINHFRIIKSGLKSKLL